ncbi:hypothetical protein C8Q77DRAFT_1155849 [Trametes polyzona]|nr:hypothetical protein C8Q77DRAFT_1155849 [Trametes polyzona]
MPSSNVFLWSIDEAGPQYIYRKPQAPRAAPAPPPELEAARPKPKRAAYVPREPKVTLSDKVAHAKRTVLNSAAVRASRDAYLDVVAMCSSKPSEAQAAAAHEARKAAIAVLDDARRLPLGWVPIPDYAMDVRPVRTMPIERAQQDWRHVVAYRAFPLETARGADPMGPGGARAVDVGRAKKLLKML